MIISVSESITVTDLFYQWPIADPRRICAVGADVRLLGIEHDIRVYAIEHDDRNLEIPHDDRTYGVIKK
jgi:hypothetical protein